MAITLCNRCDRRIDTDDGECVVDPKDPKELICRPCADELEEDETPPPAVYKSESLFQSMFHFGFPF